MNYQALVAGLVVATLGVLAGRSSAQLENEGAAMEDPLVIASEAVLDAYEAADWPRLWGLFGADFRPNDLGPALEAQELLLGRPERVLFFEGEALADGCWLRRYAAKFEKGLGRVEMRFCPEGDSWSLRTIKVLPDLRNLAEYLLNVVTPQHTGIEMMFSHCGLEGMRVPPAGGVGPLDCISITAAGETLSYVMKVSGPGQIEIVEAELLAEGPAEPARELLEPVVRKLLDRYDRRAISEIREAATPGFRESTPVALLETVVEEIHSGLGSVREAAWKSQTTDPFDGLPIVTMSVQYEKSQGETKVKLVPYSGRWAVHHFRMVAPDGTTGHRRLTEAALVRLARSLSLDPGAELSCPIEQLSERGSSVLCQGTFFGRSVEVRANYSEARETFEGDDLTLTTDDFQLTLGLWLKGLERPLGWEIQRLVCDASTLVVGQGTTCLVHFVGVASRLQVLATPEGRVRIVAAERVEP